MPLRIAPELAERMGYHMGGLYCVRDGGARGYAEGWSLWTDGWTLVAVEADLGLGAWQMRDGQKPTANAVLEYLRALPPPADGIPVSLAALREFALQGRTLRGPGPERCATCAGTMTEQGPCPEGCRSGRVNCQCDCGELEHDVQCPWCAGVGSIPVSCSTCGPLDPLPVLYGAVYGRLFNLNLLAEALRYLPVESAVLAIAQAFRGTEPYGHCLRLWADGYHLSLMGVLGELTPEHPCFGPTSLPEGLTVAAYQAVAAQQ